MIPDIVEIKCDGCGTMRKWQGYECLTLCDCLVDKHEEEELSKGGGEMIKISLETGHDRLFDALFRPYLPLLIFLTVLTSWSIYPVFIILMEEWNR